MKIYSPVPEFVCIFLTLLFAFHTFSSLCLLTDLSGIFREVSRKLNSHTIVHKTGRE